MFQNNTTDIEFLSLCGGVPVHSGDIRLAVAAALHGTHMFVAATRRKQVKTGESA